MNRIIESYRGYEIVIGFPEYGTQFAYAWRRDDESALHFRSSIEECREEIEDNTEGFSAS